MVTTGSLSNTTTTRKDGVRVDKGIEPGDNHMRVHYRITSTRADDAAVRVEESLDASFPLDALDLDANGGGDWLLDGERARVALVDIVAAGEEVTTGYVVRCADPTAVESVVDAPEIDMVDPVRRDDAPDSEEAGDRDDCGEASQAAVASAVDATAVADAIDASAVAAALDPDALASAVDADAVASALDPEAVVEAMDERAVAAALPEGALVDALVADVEADALTDAQTETLRDHLGPAFSRSDDLRLAQLRARLEDFAAYADGLEAIIDEHGTATELVDDLHRDVDAAADDVAALEAALDDASGDHASLAARLDAVEDRIEALADRIDTVVDHLDTVDAHLSRADERHERLNAQVASVDGRVDAVDDDLAAVRATVQTLERTCEASMTELAAFATDLEADVEAIDRWREQVGEAFVASDTEARTPDSIFRAADDEQVDTGDDDHAEPAEADGGRTVDDDTVDLDLDVDRDDA